MYDIAVISNDPEYLDNAVRFISNYSKEYRVLPISDSTQVNNISRIENIDIYVCDHSEGLNAINVFNARLSVGDYRPFIVASKADDEELILTAFESGISLWIKMDESYVVSFMKVARKIPVFVEKYRIEQVNKLNDRRMKSLLELNKMSSNDIDSLMAFVLEESISLTNSQIGYLAFYDSSIQQLDMKMWSKNSMDNCMVEGRPMRYSLAKSGIWGDPVRYRKPYVYNDYESAANKKGLPKGHIPLRRLLMIPLIHNDEVIGTAGVGNKLGEYDESDYDQFSLMMEGFVHILVERRQSDEKDALKSKFRNTLMKSPVGMIAFDDNLEVVDCSASASSIIGIEQGYLGKLPSVSWIADEIVDIVKSLKYSDGKMYDERMVGNVSADSPKYRLKAYADIEESGGYYLVTIEDYTSIAMLSTTIENSLLKRKTYNDLFVSLFRKDIKQMRERIKYLTDGSTREMMRVALDSIEEKITMIKEYGDLGLLSPEWVSLSEAFDRGVSVDNMHFNFDTRVDGVSILCDYTFQRVFRHMVNCSFKRGPPSKISLSYKVYNGELIIIYEDDSRGLSDRRKQSIINDSINVEDSDLFIINEAVKASGFELRETGKQSKGVRYEIIVPRDKFYINL